MADPRFIGMPGGKAPSGVLFSGQKDFQFCKEDPGEKFHGLPRAAGRF